MEKFKPESKVSNQKRGKKSSKQSKSSDSTCSLEEKKKKNLKQKIREWQREETIRRQKEDLEALLLNLQVSKLLLEMEKLSEERERIAVERSNISLRYDILSLRSQLSGISPSSPITKNVRTPEPISLNPKLQFNSPIINSSVSESSFMTAGKTCKKFPKFFLCSTTPSLQGNISIATPINSRKSKSVMLLRKTATQPIMMRSGNEAIVRSSSTENHPPLIGNTQSLPPLVHEISMNSSFVPRLPDVPAVIEPPVRISVGNKQYKVPTSSSWENTLTPKICNTTSLSPSMFRKQSINDINSAANVSESGITEYCMTEQDSSHRSKRTVCSVVEQESLNENNYIDLTTKKQKFTSSGE